MTWQPAKFKLAWITGPHEIEGYVFRGLGLHMTASASPKGRRLARWSLTHLNTGHRVAIINGDVRTAFSIAYEIARCSDWEAFTALGGWKNTDPDLPAKIDAIAARFPKNVDRNAGHGGGDEEIASKIALERA
ncbi:hypothetical protein [Aquamicrobium soli]|uniref:Uncharacterized protein n=1 Tax=Aquamicrobium soli TaxID=1811518 RepID=A0ABV7KGK1_9HYPH